MIWYVGEWNLFSTNTNKTEFFFWPTGAEGWLLGALINGMEEHIWVSPKKYNFGRAGKCQWTFPQGQDWREGVLEIGQKNKSLIKIMDVAIDSLCVFSS